MKKSIKLLGVILSAIMLLSAVSVLAFAAEADYAPYRVSCSVNGDTATRRGFCWYTKSASDSKVVVYKDGVAADVTEKVIGSGEWEGGYYHKVLVSGLAAGTTYTYKVGNGSVWSGEGTFTTDDGNDSVSFVAIADVQASNLENFKKGARALDAGLAYADGADFVVNLGDFTNDSTNEEWGYYDEAFGALNLTYTIAPAAGNHDGMGQAYWFNNMFCLDTSESVQTKNGVNYSFDVGNAHFAVVNTNDALSVSNAQMKWLKNDMNSTDKDWKIVFMHKSPYTLGKDGKWPDALYLQKKLAGVCDECGVDLVMSGHDHMYLRTKALKNNAPSAKGTTYVLSGTAGSKRYEIRTFLADSFMKRSNIANLCVQRDDLNGNRWDSSKNDWVLAKGEELENIKGSVFNTVKIEGGTLTLCSYVIRDEYKADGSFNFLAPSESVITNVDTFAKTKTTGQNRITFTGENKQKTDTVASFCDLATYALGTWLPKFIGILPDIVRSYIQDDVF